MSKRVQHVRYSVSQMALVVGLQGEVMTATDQPYIYLHDGVTVGGNVFYPDLTNQGKYLAKAGGQMTGTIGEAQWTATVAIATVDLGQLTGNYGHITGSAVNIVSFGSSLGATTGTRKTIVFDGSVTLVASANIILPNNANYTTKTGDSLTFVYEGAGIWRLTAYTLATSNLLTFGAETTTDPAASDITLTTNMTQIQYINPTAYNISAYLPVATSFATGGPISVIVNKSNKYPISVRRSDGTLIANVEPNGIGKFYLVDNSTARGTWRVEGVGTSSVNLTYINSASGFQALSHPPIFMPSAGTGGVVVLPVGASLVAVNQATGKANTLAFANSVSNVQAIDNTHLLVIYTAGSTTSFNVVVVTINSDGTLTPGTPQAGTTTAQITGGSAYFNTALKVLSNTLAIFCYINTAAVRGIAIPLSGTTVGTLGVDTLIDTATTSSAVTGATSIDSINATSGVLAYHNSGSGLGACFVAFSISGTTITFGARNTQTVTGTAVAICGPTLVNMNGVFLAAFVNSTTTCAYYTFTVSGTTITAGSSVNGTHAQVAGASVQPVALFYYRFSNTQIAFYAGLGQITTSSSACTYGVDVITLSGTTPSVAAAQTLGSSPSNINMYNPPYYDSFLGGLYGYANTANLINTVNPSNNLAFSSASNIRYNITSGAVTAITSAFQFIKGGNLNIYTTSTLNMLCLCNKGGFITDGQMANSGKLVFNELGIVQDGGFRTLAANDNGQLMTYFNSSGNTIGLYNNYTKINDGTGNWLLELAVA